MKTHNLLLLLLLILISVGACKKSDSFSNTDFNGKWVRETAWDEGLTYQMEYHFKADNTFQLLGVYVDANKRIVGYSYQQTGDYSIKKDSLITTNVVGIGAPDSLSAKGYPLPYTAKRENLKSPSTFSREAARIAFSGNTLTLSPPACPLWADCFGPLTFTRVE